MSRTISSFPCNLFKPIADTAANGMQNIVTTYVFGRGTLMIFFARLLETELLHIRPSIQFTMKPEKHGSLMLLGLPPPP